MATRKGSKHGKDRRKASGSKRSRTPARGGGGKAGAKKSAKGARKGITTRRTPARASARSGSRSGSRPSAACRPPAHTI